MNLNENDHFTANIYSLKGHLRCHDSMAVHGMEALAPSQLCCFDLTKVKKTYRTGNSKTRQCELHGTVFMEIDVVINFIVQVIYY